MCIYMYIDICFLLDCMRIWIGLLVITNRHQVVGWQKVDLSVE